MDVVGEHRPRPLRPAPAGSGYYALCETCNTVRGNQWYVPEYRDWVWAGAEIVLALREEPPPPDTIIRVPLHGVRPTLFAKQMVTMLLALNKPEVASSFPELQPVGRLSSPRRPPGRYAAFGEVAASLAATPPRWPLAVRGGAVCGQAGEAGLSVARRVRVQSE
jgi:hypothetical protein